MRKIYKVGQKINAIDPYHPNATSGGKMTDGYIGGDGKIHFRSGNAVPLPEDSEIDGYDLDGISNFVWTHIRYETPVNENLLENYGADSDLIKGTISAALARLGFSR